MKILSPHRLIRALAGAVVLLGAACADEAPVGPYRRHAAHDPATFASSTPAVNGSVTLSGVCQNLEVPAGHKLAFRTFAEGVQIYHWNGSSWSFDGPSAVLYADADGRSTVGTHYAGPTWESISGGKVTGAVLERCTPDAAAIPWLLLEATPAGQGIFHRVAFIQRVNTVGGTAPTYDGSAVGEEARVPYTTEYLFYRPQ